MQAGGLSRCPDKVAARDAQGRPGRAQLVARPAEEALAGARQVQRLCPGQSGGGFPARQQGVQQGRGPYLAAGGIIPPRPQQAGR